MIYKNFQRQLTGRLILLLLTMILFSHLITSEPLPLLVFVLVCLITYQAFGLYNFLNKSNRDTAYFLKSIRYNDFSNSYPNRKTNSSHDLLYQEFKEILNKFQEIRTEKEAQHQYFSTIIQHVGIGILTFDNGGEVQIVNDAAIRILGLESVRNLQQLGRSHPSLKTAISNLKSGERNLVKTVRNEEEIHLAVHSISLSILGKTIVLISIQNIQSELEEKEMEAWQNLIRVLTHEIMNSVTPISSLASTAASELANFEKQGSDIRKMTRDVIDDLYTSVSTIQKRSKNLIKFVTDFRNMTHIKHPVLGVHKIKDVIESILVLTKQDIEGAGIHVSLNIQPGLKVSIDREQIEQVIINIINNAIQALDASNKKEKILSITGIQKNDRIVLVTISDNGAGIEKEALQKIFIPFYTTRKNGSGIGLSLSKQIIRKHGGSISAKSIHGQGTEIQLKLIC